MDINLATSSKNSAILVVTGWRGAGKTTYCQQFVNESRKAGLKVTGLLSPVRFDQQQKNGFFTLDLESGETRLAASSIPGEIDGIQMGNWTFDPRTLEWGNQRLKQMASTEIFVIDELGPLEFDMHLGWTASFDALRAERYRLALVVIRPECIDAFSRLGFVFQTREIISLQKT